MRAKGKRETSSRCPSDPVRWCLLSQHHSTTRPSPEHYHKRYEDRFPSRGAPTSKNLLRRQAIYACPNEFRAGLFEGVRPPSNATAHLCDPPPTIRESSCERQSRQGRTGQTAWYLSRSPHRCLRLRREFVNVVVVGTCYRLLRQQKGLGYRRIKCRVTRSRRLSCRHRWSDRPVRWCGRDEVFLGGERTMPVGFLTDAERDRLPGRRSGG